MIGLPTGDARPVAVTVLAFVAAWVIARFGARIGHWIVNRQERRVQRDDSTSVIAGLKRRETALSLIQTTIRYVAYLGATLVLLSQLGGGLFTTVAGASVVVVLIGFAGQRFLTDILSGVFMVFEGWYAVGDTIVVEPWGVAGVVEEFSLRSTRLRALSGDVVSIHNSGVLAARRIPRGSREVQIEVYVNDEDAGRALFEDIVRLVPVGPTNFVQRPWIRSVDVIDTDLVRLTAGAFVPPGREWLAGDLIHSLLHERSEGLVVHGPVVTEVDAAATARFQRATSLSRTPGPTGAGTAG
jgi:moderate conductance mechanosensitive channel